jgi:hypothetical protein
VQVFGERCLSCHLGSEAIDRPGYRRLDGCAACHAITNWEGTYAGGDPTIERSKTGHAATHRLTTAIPFSQCNTCHNRGNYSLVDMTFHERTDLPPDGSAARPVAYYQPIAQFTACERELDCIDCHSSAEVMGDGDLHSAMSNVRTLECRTCHGTPTEGPATRSITDPEDPALRQAQLNPFSTLSLGETVVVTAGGGVLWNVRQSPRLELMSKVTGRFIPSPRSADQLAAGPQDQSSSACHECHAVERP